MARRPRDHEVPAAWLPVVALLVARGALGASPPVVRYEAPAQCPGEQAFREQIAARTEARGSSDGRVFSARIVAEGDEFVGRFATTTGGASVAQDVRAARCAEVVAALALITALAIDPEASTRELPPAPTASSTPPASSAPTASSTPAPPASAAAEPPPTSAPSVEARTAWRWSVGGRLLALGAVAPGASLGGGGFVDLASERPGIVAPSVRISFDAAYHSTSLDGGGSAAFRWLGGRGEGCPLRLPVGRGLDVAPCVGLGVGSLRAVGKDLANPQEASHLWVDLTAGGRLRGTWFDPVFVELQAAASRPLIGARTVVDVPPRLVHSVPAVGAIGAVGVGLRFR